MKVAIITDSPLGIEFANYVCSIGADVAIFCNQALVTDQLNLQDIQLITDKILWVQKKSISSSDLLGAERMKDFFRVVYEVHPEQIDEFNELNKINSELKTSLAKPLDIFIDVDGVIVIDKNSSTFKYSHPSGAPALGELKNQAIDGLFYESSPDQIILPEKGEVAIIGQSLYSKKSLKKIFEWALNNKSNSRRVFWITHESNPWNHIRSEELLNVKNSLDENFKIEVELFLEKNKVWQELEDYEKVKIPKPLEPIPTLVIFSAHHLSSIDTLLNSSKLYLTLEVTQLNNPAIQSENNHRDIKTISVDQLHIFNGYNLKHEWKSYLNHFEPGYLTYVDELCLLDIIQDFEGKFLKFFQR